MKGNIYVDLYHTDEVHSSHPSFPDTDKDCQIEKLATVEPYESFSMTNAASISGFEWAVDALDATQAAPAPIRLLVVGRDDTAPSSGHRAMFDEVARIDVTGYDDNGSSIVTSTIIGAGEANVDVGAGESLREVGVYTGGINDEDSFLMNRALFSNPIDKDDTIIAAVDVELTYSAV